MSQTPPRAHTRTTPELPLGVWVVVRTCARMGCRGVGRAGELSRRMATSGEHGERRARCGRGDWRRRRRGGGAVVLRSLSCCLVGLKA